MLSNFSSCLVSFSSFLYSFHLLTFSFLFSSLFPSSDPTDAANGVRVSQLYNARGKKLADDPGKTGSTFDKRKSLVRSTKAAANSARNNVAKKDSFVSRGRALSPSRGAQGGSDSNLKSHRVQQPDEQQQQNNSRKLFRRIFQR